MHGFVRTDNYSLHCLRLTLEDIDMQSKHAES